MECSHLVAGIALQLISYPLWWPHRGDASIPRNQWSALEWGTHENHRSCTSGSLIAGVIACIGTMLVYRITAAVPENRKKKNFRFGQISAASLISLAHGTNDAQKTMGVIFWP